MEYEDANAVSAALLHSQGGMIVLTAHAHITALSSADLYLVAI